MDLYSFLQHSASGRLLPIGKKHSSFLSRRIDWINVFLDMKSARKLAKFKVTKIKRGIFRLSHWRRRNCSRRAG